VTKLSPAAGASAGEGRAAAARPPRRGSRTRRSPRPASPGSHAMSSDPSATSSAARSRRGPRVRPRRPTIVRHPSGMRRDEVVETAASSTRAIADTRQARPPRTPPARGAPTSGGRAPARTHSQLDDASALEREQRRPHGTPRTKLVVRRSGRRSTLTSPPSSPNSSPRTPSPRPDARTALADHLLRAAVGLGHGREVRFRVAPQVDRAEPLHRHRVRRVGEGLAKRRSSVTEPRATRGDADRRGL
jgi:hypothetical protein